MTYQEYRKKYFADQGGAETYDLVNFHASSMQDGTALKSVYLQPKKILYFKDVWHCPEVTTAKEVAIRLLGFEDVHYIELKGYRWVYVDWNSKGNHVLEGQLTDDRKTYRGR